MLQDIWRLSTTFSLHSAHNFAFPLNEMRPDNYPETCWSCCHGQITFRSKINCQKIWALPQLNSQSNGRNRSWVIIFVLLDGEKRFRWCETNSSLMMKVQPHNHLSPQDIFGDFMSWYQAIQMVISSLYLNNFPVLVCLLTDEMGLKSLHPRCVWEA